MKDCNLKWAFACMSKLTMDKINRKLNRELSKKKSYRIWKVIRTCLSYWFNYLQVVDVWLSSSNLKIRENGRELFKFILAIRPEKSIFNLIDSIANREKFMENDLILFTEASFSLLKKYGENKIFEINVNHQNEENKKINWDEEIENEEELVDRLDQELGTSL